MTAYIVQTGLVSKIFLGLQRLLCWLVGRFIAYFLISKSNYRLLLL
jgi:hypothetical protein